MQAYTNTPIKKPTNTRMIWRLPSGIQSKKNKFEIYKKDMRPPGILGSLDW
jgi:hypothetical protein